MGITERICPQGQRLQLQPKSNKYNKEKWQEKERDELKTA
jgi:hypothetical protein